MNVVNRAVLLTTGIALACTGCAPIYIDVPPPKKHFVVTQRDVTGRIQIRSATPMDSMNEGGMLRTVDQQLSIHGQW